METQFNYPTIKVTPAIHEQLFNELKTKKRFFTAIFIKKTTGKMRVMTCKYGVKKHVNGRGLKYEPLNYGLNTVWEPKSFDPENGDKGYRSLNLNTLSHINYAEKTYQF